MKTYLLLVTYKAKPGQREKFMEEIIRAKIAENVLSEKGAICYEYSIPDSDKDVILLKEEWATEADQKAHIKHKNMKLIRNIKDQYIKSTDINII